LCCRALQVLTCPYFSLCLVYIIVITTIKMVHAVASKEDYEAALKNAGGKLVVVDFYAQWCGPCKVIAPQVEELSKQMTDVVFLKVDVDECEDIAMENQISAMPTFLFLKNGQKVEVFQGANFAKLKDTIKSHQ